MVENIFTRISPLFNFIEILLTKLLKGGIIKPILPLPYGYYLSMILMMPVIGLISGSNTSQLEHTRPIRTYFGFEHISVFEHISGSKVRPDNDKVIDFTLNFVLLHRCTQSENPGEGVLNAFFPKNLGKGSIMLSRGMPYFGFCCFFIEIMALLK